MPNSGHDAGLKVLHIAASTKESTCLVDAALTALRPPPRITTVLALDDGLRLAAQQRFDVVLLGLGVSAQEREPWIDRLLSELPHLPLIVLLEARNLAYEVLFLRKGVQDCLCVDDALPLSLGRVLVLAIERQLCRNTLIDRYRQSRESLAQFRAILDASEDAVLVVDRNRLVRFVNPAACRMLDLVAEKLLDSPFPVSFAQPIGRSVFTAV